MANIKITELPALTTLADNTVFSTVNSGVNYKSSALSIKNYITWPVTNTTGSNGPTNIAIGQNAGATGNSNVAIGISAAGTGNNIITIGTNAGQGYIGNGSILIGPTGSVSANSLIVFNATGNTLTPVSAQNDSFYVAPIRNNAGTSGVLQYNSTTKEVTYSNAITIGSKTWTFGTDGTLSSAMFLAKAEIFGATGYAGYSFTGDGGLDTGMFSAGDGNIQFYSNATKVVEIASGNITLLGHPTIEGVTSTGATGTGKLVFDNAPTISGHPTIEGVTSTGATGTGKFVFDNAPTLSGTTTLSKALVGTDANFTDWTNAKVVISQADTGHTHAYNMGVVGEAVAHVSDTAIWGVGVYGRGNTNVGTRSAGILGDGGVTNSSDTGSAVGVRGYADDTHAGGFNVGLYASATNGASNYALYMNAGDIYAAANQTWYLNGTLTFNGTNVVTVPTLKVKDVRDTVYAATFASTFTPDGANGAIQNVTLTGSITINAFANPVAGQTITLILTQGGSGSYTLTSSMKFAGGLKTLSTAVGSVDLLTITYTGSVYYASLVVGFV
jgi:hypothetical protein